MGRLRIVVEPFTANTLNHVPTEPRAFAPGEALVFLRHEADGSTVFGRVDDVPTHQPAPPQRLPEYIVGTVVFDRSVRLLQH
jgi:hypothetical protein